eukprot:GHVO01010514.1.p1 GENE.GHVO01010514.1~~GHVO01010514.1.p1  ORF type:complete len:185 (+),score=30.81 GHVO01010514.1:60-614(+)
MLRLCEWKQLEYTQSDLEFLGTHRYPVLRPRAAKLPIVLMNEMINEGNAFISAAQQPQGAGDDTPSINDFQSPNSSDVEKRVADALSAAPIPETDFWTKLDATDHLLEDCLIANSKMLADSLPVTILPAPTTLSREDIVVIDESNTKAQMPEEKQIVLTAEDGKEENFDQMSGLRLLLSAVAAI